MESKVPVDYFRNPSPTSFLNNKPTSKQLEKVLIVSNHAPAEIEQAGNLLREKGITVDHLGDNGKRYSLISPDDISNYDLVISIGKTVQYCILSEKPIYIYDTFGGPGYLTKKNYQKVKKANFSGRGYKKKTAQKIFEEIINGWNNAQLFAKNMPESERNNYRLDYVIEKIIKETKHRKKSKISRAQELSIFYAQRLARYRFFDAYVSEKRHKTIRVLEAENSQLKQKINGTLFARTKRLVKRVIRKIVRIIKGK